MDNIDNEDEILELIDIVVFEFELMFEFVVEVLKVVVVLIVKVKVKEFELVFIELKFMLVLMMIVEVSCLLFVVFLVMIVKFEIVGVDMFEGLVCDMLKLLFVDWFDVNLFEIVECQVV